MFIELYHFDHNILHICFWTLPAIIVGLVMIIMAAVHNRNQKKRQEAFDKEMEELAPLVPEIPEAVEA